MTRWKFARSGHEVPRTSLVWGRYHINDPYAKPAKPELSVLRLGFLHFGILSGAASGVSLSLGHQGFYLGRLHREWR